MRVALISVTEDRAKTHNLRRDPRASLYVSSQDNWAYAVGEGEAELGPTATAPDDEALEGLIGYYRALSGEQRVPFILSRPLTPEYRHRAETRRLRNFDIFDFALNGVE